MAFLLHWRFVLQSNLIETQQFKARIIVGSPDPKTRLQFCYFEDADKKVSKEEIKHFA